MRPGVPISLLLALSAVTLAGTACDDRERTNPLDPMNDETGGTPDWLVAIAENGSVALSWRAAPAEGFAAFELFRHASGLPVQLVGRFEAPDVVGMTDSLVVNGVEYTYALDLVLADGSRIELPEKVATPGSAVPWVVESGALGLLRFSPDGRRIRARTGSGGGAFDLSAAPDGTTVWAADYFAGQVQQYDASGAYLSLVEVSRPFRIAVDFSRQIVWAASWALETDPILHAFEMDGDEVARFTLDEEVRDLVVDETSGACYAALGRGGGIARAAVGDTLRRSDSRATIMMLALDPGARIYGGDPLDGGVYGFDLDTLVAVVTAPTVQSPQSMTVGDGCLWVAEGSERLLCLDPALALLRDLEGVGLATGMATDAETGTLWLALPTAGRVLRLSIDGKNAGEIVTSIPLFQPFGISIGRLPPPRAAVPAR